MWRDAPQVALVSEKFNAPSAGAPAGSECVLQVRDVTMQNEYNIRLKDAEMAERLRKLTEESAAERDADRIKFEKLQSEKMEKEQHHEAEVKELAERHQVIAVFKCTLQFELCVMHVYICDHYKA
jgi:hypothetical protein